ncbi:hypothetical protein LOC68_04040 [Blastopirellula sp. JC732]|uniref:Uncharacterized protein n=1 Tax=Blastopirellula sediminis TaxID=2894196 RepID=A0A9X1SHW8_9BACT|nr:hypothetical protein [Blastopirellula sediminis]MCC9609670.1 hypothetical protein [Blastopirellula sediminis]MCC9627554.1 hypothetical protein [Blastopirellula sediminis]
MLRNWLAIVVCILSTGSVLAADFQVTNTIFVDNDMQPFMTTQTIFKENVVYDYSLGQVGQAMIIDFDANRVTLLDPQRKRQLSLDIREIIETSTYMRTHLDLKKPLLTFCNKPQFQVQNEPQNNRVVFGGNPLTYDLTTQPITDKRIVQDYARFCDWSADINFAYSAGLPAQARKEVNGYFSQNNVLPVEIRRVIRDANPAANNTVRSQHVYRWTLNQTDLVTVQHLRDQQAQFEKVTLTDWIQGQAK